MEKWLCWCSLGVAGLLFVLFGLDLILKIPFGSGIDRIIDILVVICSGLLGYLSWNALRDLR